MLINLKKIYKILSLFNKNNNISTKLEIDPKLLSNIIYKRLNLLSMFDFIFPSKNNPSNNLMTLILLLILKVQNKLKNH